MSGGAPIILWFRQDLRLADNPALSAAVASGRPIVPLYILDDAGDWAMGGASRWWLHHSLQSLSRDLQRLKLEMVLRRGDSETELRRLLAETHASAVYWNRVYEPHAVARDTRLKAALGVETKSFNASLLREPWELKTGGGGSFKVFTPFFRALSASLEPVDPPPAPEVARPFVGQIDSDTLDSWALTPRKPNWAHAFPNHWQPGEAGAKDKLVAFIDGALKGYSSARDVPGHVSTSRLSPHLHFGEIGPRQVWRAAGMSSGSDTDIRKFQAELGWREFSHHLLFHSPELPSVNLRREFDVFPWIDDDAAFRAWTQGRTGVPIVDAGMRELWATGWMHNRVRMIAASFLVKNLLIDWRRGAHWFWDTLVDADLANNSASWQWVAGSGADAAPYFRIFNPVLQGRKFDADGAYVRKWVPELARLDNEDVQAPWEANASKLASANVQLGVTYPLPIVDLASSRTRALAAFASLKSAA
jgi:deoxyribodipyrimidine photo-lyase